MDAVIVLALFGGAAVGVLAVACVAWVLQLDSRVTLLEAQAVSRPPVSR